jgi:hypothetical protein
MNQPEIVAECSDCGQEFRDLPKDGERIDDLLFRVRARFDAHVCGIDGD